MKIKKNRKNMFRIWKGKDNEYPKFGVRIGKTIRFIAEKPKQNVLKQSIELQQK